MRQDFRAIESPHCEGFLERRLGRQAVVDAPGFEEACAVGSELESGLDLLVL